MEDWRQVATYSKVGLAAALTAVIVTTAGCIGPLTAKKHHESKSKAPPAKTMKFVLASQKYDAISVKVPAKPVASAPSSTPGVTFELYTVTRADRAVRVVFALNHADADDYNAAYATADLNENGAITWHDASRVALVDTKNLKEYKTFLENGDDGNCLCSVTWSATGQDSGVEHGDRTYYVAEVAAPPANVKQVTVRAGVTDIPDVNVSG